MKARILLLNTLLFLSVLLTAQTTGKTTDSRDGKVYETVKTGKQEWMAQNINFANPNSWCYQNNPKYCEEFGRLYSYIGAVQACPPGWRLPTMKDWDKLIETVGEEYAAIELRKDGSSGFNALLAGVRYDFGEFNHLNENAYFWSHVFSDKEPAWVYLIGRTMHNVARIQSFSGTGFSVRCIRR